MKKIIAIITILPSLVFGASIEILITDITPLIGNISLALNTKKTYDNEAENSVYAIRANVKKNTMRIIITDIEKGDYAISVFHDKNSNHDLDTNLLGMPTERYGFSNNAVGLFGKPDFDEAKITLSSHSQMTTIKLHDY